MAINKKFIIGVDVGGSKIGAVLFGNGKILKSVKIPTPKNKNEFFKSLKIIVGKMISGIDRKELAGIGCGIAGALDLKSGAILNSPNLRFLNNSNIKNWIEKEFKCDVKIDNDARCFTRAEYLYGLGRGYKDLVGITLGTGIGGGIIFNGKMFYGANGAAGEFGHMVIDCGEDLETLTIKQMRKFSKISAEEFEKNLEIGIANIINILDPEVIIIGGGAAKTVKTFLPKMKMAIAKFIVSPKSRKNVKIIAGGLGENAGAMGAAALFTSRNM